jgi:hypothetical protein
MGTPRFPIRNPCARVGWLNGAAPRTPSALWKIDFELSVATAVKSRTSQLHELQSELFGANRL